MADPEDTLSDSPVDFGTAVAYALHPEMRRLLILYAVGALLLSAGTGLFFDPGFLDPVIVGIVQRLIGLAVVLVGATFFFGGLVGAAFKLVADANILAAEATEA
ncbi:MAG: hypothetical protein ABEH66_04140 [Halobacteriales archaeon]